MPEDVPNDMDEQRLAMFAEMLRTGGRSIGGEWVAFYSHATSNCTGVGFDGNRPPQHHRCEGWCAPLSGARKCICPCHDIHRPTYQEARAVAEQRAAEYMASRR